MLKLILLDNKNGDLIGRHFLKYYKESNVPHLHHSTIGILFQ